MTVFIANVYMFFLRFRRELYWSLKLTRKSRLFFPVLIPLKAQMFFLESNTEKRYKYFNILIFIILRTNGKIRKNDGNLISAISMDYLYRKEGIFSLSWNFTTSQENISYWYILNNVRERVLLTFSNAHNREFEKKPFQY